MDPYFIFAEAGGDIVHIGVEKIVFWVVIIIVALSHMARLCVELLHWPKWLVSHFESLDKERIDRIVKEIVTRQDEVERNRISLFQSKARNAGVLPDPKSSCRRLLANVFHPDPVSVGRAQPTTLSYYVDAMSGCVDPVYCSESASVLASFIQRNPSLMERGFVRIIGLKGGSPTLAIALAQRLDLPASLFRGRSFPKYQGSALSDVYFDGNIVEGERVLIVDDSTTGGRMMLEAVKSLRELNARVSHAVVMFEPIGKQAREKLSGLGVELFSVIQMSDEEINEIRELSA